jgi:hypothetical protein
MWDRRSWWMQPEHRHHVLLSLLGAAKLGS